MHATHAIVGHAVLVPLLFAALAAVIYVAFHLDAGVRSGHLDDPLDAELVGRWNARTH